MSYTALVLTPESHDRLVNSIDVPEGWETLAHHMTINMGSPEQGPANELVGQEAPLTIVSQAQDDKVMAVGVESPIPSKNEIKHMIRKKRSNGNDLGGKVDTKTEAKVVRTSVNS